MIGFLIVTHGAIGREMLTALQGIVGEVPQSRAIEIGAQDDSDERMGAILSAIGEVNKGDGVIIFTDMFGGTPSNLALAAMPRIQAVVLAGVNMPMLIKLVAARKTLSLLDAARAAEEAGRAYIRLVAENFINRT